MDAADTVFIYGLVDPRTQTLRYVGKAKDPRRRYVVHLSRAKRLRGHKEAWVESLRNAGIRPEMVVIEEVKTSEWQTAERFWIGFFRHIGVDLVNGTAGGDGGETFSGRQHSVETKAKCAAAKVGNKCNLGKKGSPEKSLRLSLAHTGLKRSAQAKANMREGWKKRRGQVLSEETKEKLRQAALKRWHGLKTADDTVRA